MRYLIFHILILSSCVTTEYHAASPLTMSKKVDITSLNSYKLNFDCPYDEDQLLCTYARLLLTEKGYLTEEVEGKKARRDIGIKITSQRVKSYGSGTFDFILWLLSITTWPYETQKFFKIDLTISSDQKIKMKDSFYAHYSNNYSWVYTITRLIRERINDPDKLPMEEAGSKDLYNFIENSIASSLNDIEEE